MPPKSNKRGANDSTKSTKKTKQSTVSSPFTPFSEQNDTTPNLPSSRGRGGGRGRGRGRGRGGQAGQENSEACRGRTEISMTTNALEHSSHSNAQFTSTPVSHSLMQSDVCLTVNSC